MEYIKTLIDFILHIDVHLQALLIQYGIWIYGILFAIIFVETGLVIMPFLPGDSLLFVAWSLAGGWYINIVVLLIILFVAAVLGDTVNYYIGKYFGNRLLKRKFRGKLMINPHHIQKTQQFFHKHGKKTIILARFVPIVRTIAPFVAGIGNMPYKTFFAYNVIGWFLRIFSLTLAGYFFGQIPFIKANFQKVVLLIIFISLLPLLIEYIRHKMKTKKNESTSYTEQP